jgi:hypothetical protein
MNLVEHADSRTNISIDYEQKNMYIAIDSALWCIDALVNSPTVHQIEVPKVTFTLFDSIILPEQGRKFNTINDQIN